MLAAPFARSQGPLDGETGISTGDDRHRSNENPGGIPAFALLPFQQ